MFVGGEFYNDPVWLADTPTLSTQGMTFLNGGKACLIVISEVLLSRDIQHILLPAYLCPTIVNTLEHSGLTCELLIKSSQISQLTWMIWRKK